MMVFLLALWLGCAEQAVTPPDSNLGVETPPAKAEPILRSCFASPIMPEEETFESEGSADIGELGDVDGGSSDADEEPAIIGSPDSVAEPAPVPQPGQAKEMDWGARIFLSNDDSMSLASAQRVLYALQSDVPLVTSQIRPHELLNYFSFDTKDVRKGQLFSVSSAAEQKEDVLSLALSVQGAVPERRPLDLTLVIDRSGSMSGEGRMDYTKRGLTLLTDSLVDGDRVDMVLFESGFCTPVEGFVVGRDDKQLLLDAIKQLEPLGSTDLDGGLREAYRIQSGRTDASERNRRVLLLTDALLNTGNVDVDLVSEVGRQFEANKIRLTGVGVGRDFNDEMLDKLTEKGKGAYVYLGSEAVVDRVFGTGFQSLTQTIAHDVRFALQLPDSLAMERFYGEESSTNPEDVQPINYYAGTSQLFLQDLKIKEGQLANDQQLVLSIEYIDAVSGEASTRQFTMKVGELLDSDHRNVNKAQALMAFSDVLLARSMGNSEGCTAGLDTYKERAAEVGEDAEVAYVDSLVANMDCSNLQMPGVSAGGPTVRPIPTFLSSSDGARGADEVKRTVRRYTGQLRYCGDRMLRDGESVAGKLNLSMQILEGRVVEVEVKKNGTGSDKLGACTTNKAKRWRFPETAAGTFVYEIKFVVK